MDRRPPFLALAAAVAGGLAAGAALALGAGAVGVGSSGTGTVGPGTIVTAPTTPAPGGGAQGTAAEQTHPSVQPGIGGTRTRFTLRLTLADAPGHAGVLATDYRLAVSVPPRRSSARCAPPPPATIVGGVAHEVVHVALVPPLGGWCHGRYAITVFLQLGPYCPKPAPGRPPPPCPEFAERDVDVGHSHFTVVKRR